MTPQPVRELADTHPFDAHSVHQLALLAPLPIVPPPPAYLDAIASAAIRAITASFRFVDIVNLLR